MSCESDKFKFLPGETKPLEIHLYDYVEATDCETVYGLPSNPGRKISVTVPGNPNDLTFTLLTVPPVVVAEEKPARLTLALTPTQTALMISGTIRVEIDATGTGANVTKAVLINGVEKMTTMECG